MLRSGAAPPDPHHKLGGGGRGRDFPSVLPFCASPPPPGSAPRQKLPRIPAAARCSPGLLPRSGSAEAGGDGGREKEGGREGGKEGGREGWGGPGAVWRGAGRRGCRAAPAAHQPGPAAGHGAHTQTHLFIYLSIYTHTYTQVEVEQPAGKTLERFQALTQDEN